MTEVRVQGLDFVASAVFRVVLGTPTTAIARQLPRKERWVLLLLDGRRSVSDLAHLTQRSELDVAATIVRFLQWGYIQPVSAVKDNS